MNKTNLLLTRMRQNWKSGVTVALVSLPLSVSLAIASQTTPIVGIITAIWAGLMGALFGGSNFNIIGPTGALSGILATFAIIHGADTLPALAVVSGILILASYLLRLERFLIFIPGSTIQGFTLGVAFIIGFNQMNFALGLNGLAKHEKFILNVLESFKHVGSTSPGAVFVFALFLAGLFLLLKLTPKIPGAITLTPIGILLGFLSQNGYIPLSLQTLGTKFGNINPTLFIRPTFFFDYSLLVTAVTVAVVAILETMISAKIADGMTKTKHNSRKEMLGLGMANIMSGLMGGIPATAALARTAVNIKSGANSNVSAVISCTSIAIISLLLLPFFNYIPMAVIASILVFAALRMIEIHEIVNFIKHDKKSLLVCLLVFFITVYEDPMIGILAGTAVSLLIFIEKLSRGQFDLIMNDPKKGIVGKMSGEKITSSLKDHDTLVYSIKGTLAYINGQAHVVRFSQGLNGYKNIILRLRELYFIDLDGIDALDEIIDIIRSQKRKVVISSVEDAIAAQLERESDGYRSLKKDKLIFSKTTDALKFLGYNPGSIKKPVRQKK